MSGGDVIQSRYDLKDYKKIQRQFFQTYGQPRYNGVTSLRMDDLYKKIKKFQQVKYSTIKNLNC